MSGATASIALGYAPKVWGQRAREVVLGQNLGVNSGQIVPKMFSSFLIRV